MGKEGDRNTARTNAPKIIGQKVLRPREQVEDTIRKAILSGQLKSGETLPPEAELARQFNVSRTTLREALRALSSQHLIKKTPGAGGGNTVQYIDYQSLGTVLIDAMDNLLALGSIRFDELAEVRQYLEIPAVRLAAKNRTEDELQQLTEIVSTQRSVSVADPEVSTLDRQFHTLIARASGNRVLASLVTALHNATEPVNYLSLSPEVGRETVRQHQSIVRALAARDAAAAEQAIVRHLSFLQRHISEHQNEKLSGSDSTLT